MEYYIFKMYEKEKKNNQDIEPGFKRFPKQIKRIFKMFFTVMILGGVEMFVATIVARQSLWSALGVIIVVVTAMVLAYIDARDQNKNMEKYIGSYQKKLELLYDLLVKEFNIDTRKKVDELIAVYQRNINKKEKEEKRRNKIAFTILTGVSGVLSISFANMDKIGIDFSGWVYLATVVSLLVVAGGSWVYFCSYFDPIKKKYESMIKDLRDMQLMKY